MEGSSTADVDAVYSHFESKLLSILDGSPTRSRG